MNTLKIAATLAKLHSELISDENLITVGMRKDPSFHVRPEFFLEYQLETVVVARDSKEYPFEISAMVDGVKFYAVYDKHEAELLGLPTT